MKRPMSCAKPRISLFLMLLVSMLNIYSQKETIKKQLDILVKLSGLLSKFFSNFYKKTQTKPEMVYKFISKFV